MARRLCRIRGNLPDFPESHWFGLWSEKHICPQGGGTKKKGSKRTLEKGVQCLPREKKNGASRSQPDLLSVILNNNKRKERDRSKQIGYIVWLQGKKGPE